MALSADRWDMAIHVGALSISAIAYHMVRCCVDNTRYTCGTGEVATLGGCTSAVALGLEAILMIAESLSRLIEPKTVLYPARTTVEGILGLANGGARCR